MGGGGYMNVNLRYFLFKTFNDDDNLKTSPDLSSESKRKLEKLMFEDPILDRSFTMDCML